jgi:hypothetical protein
MSTVSRASIEIQAIGSAENYKKKLTDPAITRVQALVRGFLVRKSLPPHLRFARECTQLAKTQGYIPHTIASAGNTPVWFPEAFPRIVMKFSPNPQFRLYIMDRIRNTLQAQQSSHAIVPKAKIVEKDARRILIEERLPVNIDHYYNMHLYVHNTRQFDNVVRELVRLFSKEGGLGDLLREPHYLNPFTQIKGTGGGIRYDNFPLYLDKNQEGCVGLIDLERMGLISFSDGCKTLARIFPFHCDLILDEVEKCGYSVEREALKKSAKQGILALDKGVKLHETWLEKNHLFSKKTIEMLDLSEKEKLISLVKQIFVNEDQSSKDFNNLYKLSPRMSLDSARLCDIEFHRKPLDQSLDIEWALAPHLSLIHPEVSASTLATQITLYILKSLQENLPRDGDIPSLATCEKGEAWKVIRSRSPLVDFSKQAHVVDGMIRAHQKFIERIYISEPKSYFPLVWASAIIDTVTDYLIAQRIIFSCDSVGSFRYWVRY